jgi:hypothetical protein
MDNVIALGMQDLIDNGINIIHALGRKYYFDILKDVLINTDILWTKPSEMSFYTGLGLPIIIAPPLGTHESYNRQWLQHIGSGFDQENPKFAADWLFYMLENGRLANAAWEGFLQAPKLGTYKIEKFIHSA